MIYAKTNIALGFFVKGTYDRRSLPKGSVVHAREQTVRKTIDYLGYERSIYELHGLYTPDGYQLVLQTLILGQELRLLSPLELLSMCAE